MVRFLRQAKQSADFMRPLAAACSGYWSCCFTESHCRCNSEIERIIENGGYMVSAILLFSNSRSRISLFQPPPLKFSPALLAIENLGKEYRFETHFFIDKKNNLFIKGYGDPLLTSEVISGNRPYPGRDGRSGNWQRCTSMTSSFALNGEIAGEENSANPYDAPNGALAVNFNALPLQIAKDGSITSGEPQTPVISLMSRGSQTTCAPACIALMSTPCRTRGQLTPALRYAGELFVMLFQTGRYQRTRL